MTIKEGGFFSSTPYGGPNEGGNFLSNPHGYQRFGVYVQGNEAPEWTHNIHCKIGTSARLELIKQYQDNGNAFADMNSSGVCFGHVVVCEDQALNTDISAALERCEYVHTTTQQREPWRPGLDSPRGCYLDANDNPILPAWQNAQGEYHPVSRQGPYLMSTKSGDGEPRYWPDTGFHDYSYGQGIGLGFRLSLPWDDPIGNAGKFFEKLVRGIEGTLNGRGSPLGRRWDDANNLRWFWSCDSLDLQRVGIGSENGCLEVYLIGAGSWGLKQAEDRVNDFYDDFFAPRRIQKPGTTQGVTGPGGTTVRYETIFNDDGSWYVRTITTDSNGNDTIDDGPLVFPPWNSPTPLPTGIGGGLGVGGGGVYTPGGLGFPPIPDFGGGLGVPGAPSNGGGNPGGPGGPGTVNPEAPEWTANPNGGGNNGFGGEFVPPGGDPDAPGGSGLVQTTHPRWPAPLHQDAPPYWYLQPKSINSKSLNAWFTDNNNKLTQRSKGSLPYALASWDSVYWPNPKNPDPTKIWDTHHIMTGQNVPLWAKLDLNLDITAESPTKNTLPIDNQTNIRFPNHWVSSNTETSSNAVSFPRNTNGLNLSIEQSRSLKTTPHKSFFVPSYVDVTSTVYKTIPTKSTWPLDILSYSKTLGTSISTANPSVSI